MNTNAYQNAGYETRKDYLRGLAENFGLSTSIVFELASVLGPNEDFDGLVTGLEDYAEMYGDEDEYE